MREGSRLALQMFRGERGLVSVFVFLEASSSVISIRRSIHSHYFQKEESSIQLLSSKDAFRGCPISSNMLQRFSILITEMG